MRLRTQNRYVIVLDDDPGTHRIIAAATGVKTLSFLHADDILARPRHFSPAALFLDIHLAPDVTGLSFVPLFKKCWPTTPIIVVTSNLSTEALSAALAAGADDFIEKPLRPAEVLARLQVRLAESERRLEQSEFRIGDITVNATTRTIEGEGGGQAATLSRTAISLLITLVQARDTVVKRETLKQFWGQLVVTDNALDRKMYEVRQALKATSQSVSVRGVYGQGFVLDVSGGES